jgi:hypothetical protein
MHSQHLIKTALSKPLLAWALGQGLMVLLTAWDRQWDTLMGAHLKRLYKSYYDAG